MMYCSNAAATAHNYSVIREKRTESDDCYRKRICDSIPKGAVHWAEDLANAHGEELDDIGAHWNMPRAK